jgi:hypothetical protein
VHNIIINKYKHRSRIKQLRQKRFKTFKEVISLNAFKEHFTKDFYSPKELVRFKKIFNVDNRTLNEALMKRSLLNKIIVNKYYFLFSVKQFPNRFYKHKRKYFKRKKRRRKLKLRIKFFYRIAHDTFLFYLNLSGKQFIIRPFNFLNCLFFYKKKNFKKVYVIRKRRRMRFRFYSKFRRRKKRRTVRRRRIRFVKYKFKKKIVMNRLKQIKIRKYKNFLRFIAFFNVCKKITLKPDDYFTVKSILNSPYKLLKFNFNKITNSYNFFLNFNSQRKQKIRIDSTKNVFYKEKTKLYNIIKLKLQNRFILTNKVNKPFFDTNSYFKSLLKSNIKSNVKYNNTIDYLSYNNKIKQNISKNYQNNSLKNNIKKSDYQKKLLLFIKVIKKISKKIFFFEKKIRKFKNKRKNQLSFLFLNSLKKNNRKLIKKFKKYKQFLNILLDIIIKLKNKLIKLIINFYIFIFKNKKHLNLKKKKKHSRIFKKIKIFLKRTKKDLTLKSNLKKKNRLILSFFFNKKKFIFFDNNKFPFLYKNKVNNYIGKPWKVKRFIKKNHKRKRHVFFKHIKKNFSISNFFLYKNYFSNKNLLKNDNYSEFGNKKFKWLYLNFLKKSNLFDLKNVQKKKNINFLK